MATIDEIKELKEIRELWDFLESPYCSFAVMQYLSEKGKTKDVPGNAGRLLDRLLFNELIFPDLLSGRIVIRDGGLYPGGLVEPDRSLT